MLDRASRAIRGLRPATGVRFMLALAIVSFLAAIVSARIHGPGGPWLWNLDLPKIDYPLASFFHDALTGGRLPLWNDDLGLGYPLYAEGQIGAFYPPNWFLFRFEPLVALDLTRLLHLTIAGVGTGVLTLRLSGSRSGAVTAALVAVLGGAIVAKLEWHNLVAAYAFLPWVLVPLVRRPAPSRVGLVAAGVLFGVQAWTGHPNTWLLTGLAAAVVMLAISPRWRTLGRVVGFGLLGAAVGAVQLIPTALLTTLSVRSHALSANDLFTSAATPFDILLFAFQNAFVRSPGEAWDPPTIWYPDGTFALFEAAAYVGLPVLALAAVGVSSRRARPLVALILVGIAIPVVAAFRPEPWMGIPFLNGLRSPVRSYVLVALAIAVIAGLGVGRLGRSKGALRRATATLAIPVVAYIAVVSIATWAPDVFDRLLLGSSTFLGPEDLPDRRGRAVEAMTSAWPLAMELAAGVAMLVLIMVAGRRPSVRLALIPAAVGIAAIPLLWLGPLPNGTRPASGISFADTPFVRAVGEADPYRVLTLHPPGWYAGMPDQLAAAHIADLRMFSSLDLMATDRLVRTVSEDDPTGAIRRVVGIDTVVTFDQPCPGRLVATVETEHAFICHDDQALRPPYWLPADAAAVREGDTPSPIRPGSATIDIAMAATAASEVADTPSDGLGRSMNVDAPAPGWVWIDRAWWPAWRTSVDGEPVESLEALGGQLIPVGAGRHVVQQSFVPLDALLGLALGAIAIAIAIAWVDRGRSSPARPPRVD